MEDNNEKKVYICSKEGEIAALHEKVDNLERMTTNLERIVVTGNGESLAGSITKLVIEVSNLKIVTEDLKTGVSGFLKFQQNYEGIQFGKKQNKWIIGILVTITIFSLGAIITLVVALVK